MKRLVIILLCICIMNMSCENEEKIDPYLIGKNHIGLLTDSTQVRELESIYASDSIVKFIKGDEFTGDVNDINIYSKKGKKLLTLTPSQALDSTSNIQTIQVFDSQFKTKKNLSAISTFKDIKDNYKISKIENLINSIVVLVNEINASFTIDKEQLPPNLRYDMNITIEKVQIPDGARIKYFMIHWD